jgi:hypothetical protein
VDSRPTRRVRPGASGRLDPAGHRNANGVEKRTARGWRSP